VQRRDGASSEDWNSLRNSPQSQVIAEVVSDAITRRDASRREARTRREHRECSARVSKKISAAFKLMLPPLSPPLPSPRVSCDTSRPRAFFLHESEVMITRANWTRRRRRERVHLSGGQHKRFGSIVTRENSSFHSDSSSLRIFNRKFVWGFN